MKRIIPFSRYFLPAAVFSALLAAGGGLGFIVYRGFNLGVDFQAGLIQEVQFAPTAFHLTYRGRGNASISMDRNTLRIVLSGPAVEGATYNFPYTAYPQVGGLTAGLSQVEGLEVRSLAAGNTPSTLLIQSAQGNLQLQPEEPYVVHYLPLDASPIAIEDVRASLSPLGTVSVQNLGERAERRFMIRMEDNELGGENSAVQIRNTLEARFGSGGVAITRSDYVGSRFSKNLTDQAGVLMGLTMLLIFIYASVRFKPQYAIGAVLALIHDVLIMAAFIVWTRMEFNTTTIAALLTIVGYSINDTIVIFDRIRETRRIYPDDSLVAILDRAVTETLGRTIITTVTTMIAVLSLFIFTKGSMKDFALALLVGMTSGVYSTIFIASGFVYFWEYISRKRAQKHPHPGVSRRQEAVKGASS